VISTLLLFIAGTIVSALAHNVPTILIGKGVAGSWLWWMSFAHRDYHNGFGALKFRAGYFGAIGVAWALGSTLSPLIGGAFTEKVTWRENLFPISVILMVSS
jgi:MFS family permease